MVAMARIAAAALIIPSYSPGGAINVHPSTVYVLGLTRVCTT